jgi:hypothetical protein
MPIEMYVEGYSENQNKEGLTYAASIHLPANYHIAEDFTHQLRQYLASTYTDSLTIEYSPEVPLLDNLMLDTTNIHELNFLAMRLNDMSMSQLAVYNGLLPLVIDSEKMNKISDLINLTYAVNDYVAMPDINNDKALGEFLIENELIEGIDKMSDRTIALLDRRVLGEIQRRDENGVFVDGYYVQRAGFELPQVYDGTLIDYHPEDFLFRFMTFDKDGEGVKTITIPLSEEDAKYVETMRSHSFFNCFESGLKPITKLFREDGTVVSRLDIEKFDALAKTYLDLDMMSQIYIKSGLAYEELNSFDEIEKVKAIFNDVYDRVLFNECVFADQFGKDYLARRLDESFPKKLIDYVDTGRLGAQLMKELDGRYTDYGIMIDKSMTQLLSYDVNKEYQAVRVAGMYALYTPERVNADYLPEGCYKYELRSGGDYEFATLEEKVRVDFAGTVIVNQPIDISDKGYVDLTEKGMELTNLEGRLSVAEYMSDEPPAESPEIEEMGSVLS